MQNLINELKQKQLEVNKVQAKINQTEKDILYRTAKHLILNVLQNAAVTEQLVGDSKTLEFRTPDNKIFTLVFNGLQRFNFDGHTLQLDCVCLYHLDDCRYECEITLGFDNYILIEIDM